ncbi:HD domain-containing protein [Actinocorallia herbida]|uniref:HD domain-containing protein n=1 Tax=Actinocorallia herbida TaxID=58109 RepID=A0A3N1D7W3_9ACTN|nr:HD domain-containing protein [Actinocorallia herbida]ROO89581.1 HD domain-containing protein [Actinocorallia herbida]
MKNTAAWAREIARDLLEEPLPRRWAHTQGVAAKARTLTPILGNNADLLEAAAWLHDIGYSPKIQGTGFHPLDGARHLRDVDHASHTLCCLVANHSCALIEAAERGMAHVLSEEFPSTDQPLADALIYCDMTTAPDGVAVAFSDRLAEIRQRYGPHDLVTRFIDKAERSLDEAVRAVERKVFLLV